MKEMHEVYIDVNSGEVALDVEPESQYNYFELGSVSLQTMNGVSLHSLIYSFMSQYLLWQYTYRVETDKSIYHRYYYDYDHACSCNPGCKVTYLWEESEFLGTTFYRNINQNIAK